MKEGMIVSWQIEGASSRGRGTVIADEHGGHVPVAVQRFGFGESLGYHPVIWCAVTWLQVEGDQAQGQPPPALPPGSPVLTPADFGGTMPQPDPPKAA